MKKILLLLGLLPGILSAQSIRAIYSTPTFNSPQGPYVEINTSIDATSLNYVDVSGEQRSNVIPKRSFMPTKDSSVLTRNNPLTGRYLIFRE